jgi:hypothetical protein
MWFFWTAQGVDNDDGSSYYTIDQVMASLAATARPPHSHHTATTQPPHSHRTATAQPPHSHHTATALPTKDLVDQNVFFDADGFKMDYGGHGSKVRRTPSWSRSWANCRLL